MSVKSYFCPIQLISLLIPLHDLWFSKNSRVQAIITIIYKQTKLYILSNSRESVDSVKSTTATEHFTDILFYVFHLLRDLPP